MKLKLPSKWSVIAFLRVSLLFVTHDKKLVHQVKEISTDNKIWDEFFKFGTVKQFGANFKQCKQFLCNALQNWRDLKKMFTGFILQLYVYFDVAFFPLHDADNKMSHDFFH